MAKKNTKNTPEVPQPEPKPEVPHTPHAWTVKQWQQAPLIQADLQRHLNDPVVKAAFQTLLLMVMPNAKPAIELIPGVSAEAMMLRDNNRFHHRAGMTALYKLLHGLARPVNAPAGSKPQWGELLATDE